MKLYSLLSEILKTALRVEKKLDELLVAQKKANPALILNPFSFRNQMCPLCQRAVEYIPVAREESPGHEMIRICGCTPQPTKQMHVEGE